jgi:hypothetical protein
MPLNPSLKILHLFLVFPTRAKCPITIFILAFINTIMLSEEYEKRTSGTVYITILLIGSL